MLQKRIFYVLLSWNFPASPMMKMTISLIQKEVFLVFLTLCE